MMVSHGTRDPNPWPSDAGTEAVMVRLASVCLTAQPRKL
jgi:hypothetical protein